MRELESIDWKASLSIDGNEHVTADKKGDEIDEIWVIKERKTEEGCQPMNKKD